MTLRKKILMLTGLGLAALIVVLFVTTRTILLRTSNELEEKHLHQNIDRTMGVLQRELSSLEALAHAWATRDDTYAFVATANNHYVQSNLLDETFKGSRVNLMMFMDAFGKAVFATAFDLRSQQRTPVPRALQEQLSDEVLLLRQAKVTGIILTQQGPMLVASQPIMTSAGKGPSIGTLVVARYLDAPEIQRLAETMQLSLSLHKFNDQGVPSDIQKARSSLRGHTRVLTHPLNSASLAGYSLLRDIYGKPVLMLKVEIPREIVGQARTDLASLTRWIVALCLAFGLLMIVFWENQVLFRVSRLSKAVEGTLNSRSGPSRSTAIARNDELSTLEEGVDGLLEVLKRTQESSHTTKNGSVQPIDERNKELAAAKEQLQQEQEKGRLLHEENKNLEARLQQAEKTKSASSLATGIARDFHKILMSIQGYTCLLLNDIDETRPQFNWVRRIQDQLRRGGELTKQLSKIA
jgi:sensor domain CHASE-containing protein